MNAQLTRLRTEQHIAEPQRETHSAAVRNSRLHRSELAHTHTGLVVFVTVAIGADSHLPTAHELANRLEDDIREANRR